MTKAFPVGWKQASVVFTRRAYLQQPLQTDGLWEGAATLQSDDPAASASGTQNGAGSDTAEEEGAPGV